MLGALAVTFGTKVTTTIAAADSDHPQVAEAPASWQSFAGRLQLRLQERLSSDNEDAVRFRGSIAKGDQGSGTFVVRVWVFPDGKVQRLEFEGGSNDDALHELSGALMGVGAELAPPDMPQPLRMRLSLQAKPDK